MNNAGESTPPPSFARSKALQQLFNEQISVWKRRERLGLDELAGRVGLSRSYLAQIGRYGRVPGRSSLILLALNFKLEDPAQIFRAAGLSLPWPYEEPVALGPRKEADDGLLSVKLDMRGFRDAIAQVVRAELGPKRFRDITSGRPLRVGLNRLQTMFFDSRNASANEVRGFFPTLLRVLSSSLQCDVELKDISHTDYTDLFARDKLDLFGPVFTTPRRLEGARYTRAFCSVGLSALYRKEAHPRLAPLPEPTTRNDLRNRFYQIAVLKESQAHHFVTTELALPDEQLLICETSEESLERVAMSTVGRPAHLLICDSNIALELATAHAQKLSLLFAEQGRALQYYEDAIAVRPDIPELCDLINSTMSFLSQSGSLAELLSDKLSQKYAPFVQAPQNGRI